MIFKIFIDKFKNENGDKFFSGGCIRREADVTVGFFQILAGELDDLPEAAFYLVGNIDQVKAKAAKILAEAKG